MKKHILSISIFLIAFFALFFIIQNSKAAAVTCQCSDLSDAKAEYNIETDEDMEVACRAKCTQEFAEYVSSALTAPKESDSSSAPNNCVCNSGSNVSQFDRAGCTAFCESSGGVASFRAPSQDTSRGGVEIKSPIKFEDPVSLIEAIINYVLGFVGAMAVLVIMYSGYLYLT